jgi:hypothetical protein
VKAFLGVIAFAAVLLAGCDRDPASVPPPATVPVPSSVQDCGVEVIPQGAKVLDDGRRSCLARAYQAGVRAVFTNVRPTSEGDPITTRIEVLGVNDLEVTVDATEDRFSSRPDRVVRTYRCSRLTHAAVAGGVRLLRIEGCTDGSAFQV